MYPVYLDYNATTPLDPQVAEAMRPFLDIIYGNPSSSHEYGIIARQSVEAARKELAKMLNCSPDEIIFTSGGTESNNMAIKGFAIANAGKSRHLITSSIEHPAVLEVCRYLEEPRAQSGTFSKRANGVPGLAEYILDNIFRLGRISHQPQSQTIEGTNIAVVYFPEKQLVAGRDPPGQTQFCRKLIIISRNSHRHLDTGNDLFRFHH